MDDLGFILATDVIAFGSAAGLAWWVIRRGRVLGAQVADEDKPWI